MYEYNTMRYILLSTTHHLFSSISDFLMICKDVQNDRIAKMCFFLSPYFRVYTYINAKLKFHTSPMECMPLERDCISVMG